MGDKLTVKSVTQKDTVAPELAREPDKGQKQLERLKDIAKSRTGKTLDNKTLEAIVERRRAKVEHQEFLKETKVGFEKESAKETLGKSSETLGAKTQKTTGAKETRGVDGLTPEQRQSISSDPKANPSLPHTEAKAPNTEQAEVLLFKMLDNVDQGSEKFDLGAYAQSLKAEKGKGQTLDERQKALKQLKSNLQAGGTKKATTTPSNKSPLAAFKAGSAPMGMLNKKGNLPTTSPQSPSHNTGASPEGLRTPTGGIITASKFDGMNFNWDRFFSKFVIESTADANAWRAILRVVQRMEGKSSMSAHGAQIALNKMRQHFARLETLNQLVRTAADMPRQPQEIGMAGQLMGDSQTPKIIPDGLNDVQKALADKIPELPKEQVFITKAEMARLTESERLNYLTKRQHYLKVAGQFNVVSQLEGLEDRLKQQIKKYEKDAFPAGMEPKEFKDIKAELQALKDGSHPALQGTAGLEAERAKLEEMMGNLSKNQRGAAILRQKRGQLAVYRKQMNPQTGEEEYVPFHLGTLEGALEARVQIPVLREKIKKPGLTEEERKEVLDELMQHESALQQAPGFPTLDELDSELKLRGEIGELKKKAQAGTITDEERTALKDKEDEVKGHEAKLEGFLGQHVELMRKGTKWDAMSARTGQYHVTGEREFGLQAIERLEKTPDQHKENLKEHLDYLQDMYSSRKSGEAASAATSDRDPSNKVQSRVPGVESELSHKHRELDIHDDPKALAQALLAGKTYTDSMGAKLVKGKGGAVERGAAHYEYDTEFKIRDIEGGFGQIGKEMKNSFIPAVDQAINGAIQQATQNRGELNGLMRQATGKSQGMINQLINILGMSRQMV
jgi:hypothetical protein